MEVRFRIQKDSHDNIRLIGVNQDITLRKQAEEKLHESQQLLNSIVNSAMDAIVTVDNAQHIELANPAAEKMFGYTAAELSQMPLSALMPERYRAAHPGVVEAFGNSSAGHCACTERFECTASTTSKDVLPECQPEPLRGTDLTRQGVGHVFGAFAAAGC